MFKQLLPIYYADMEIRVKSVSHQLAMDRNYYVFVDTVKTKKGDRLILMIDEVYNASEEVLEDCMWNPAKAKCNSETIKNNVGHYSYEKTQANYKHYDYETAKNDFLTCYNHGNILDS